MTRLGVTLISLIICAVPAGFAQTIQPTLAQPVPGAGSSGPSARLTGQTPIEVLNGAATRVSHYDPAQMLRLAVVLALPHPEEERQFLEDVQTKQSPVFHQFLSAEEWNARFGPSAEAEQAVVDWAVSQGLTVTHRYENRLAVDLEAPAGTIEKALDLTINRYQLPAADGLEARIAYANNRNPALPASLSAVVDAVLGLNSIEVARPAGGSGRLVPQPDYVPGPAEQTLDSAQRDATPGAVPSGAEPALSPAGVTPPKPGFWQPTDMWSSYGYDYQALMNQGHCCNPLNNPTTYTPRETSIAIASFGDVSLSDVSDFQQAFPYLAWNVEKIGIDGGYTCNNTAKSTDDNCGEVTMDTEWSLAMANSEGSTATTSKVYVYEGSGYTNAVIMDVYTHMQDNAHARTMSTSWGWAENTQFSSNPEMDTYNATMKSVDKVLASMAGQGWTLVAASGDNGATAGCNDAIRVQFPSSDPNVVAVGGTELNEGSTSSAYEVAWTGGTGKGSCTGNHGGSTGGASGYWTTPGYQNGMGFSMRAVPDVALESFYGHAVYFNGGWAYLAGTSVAAPMMAGFFAQENAYLLAIGSKCGSGGTSACAPLGNANYAMYQEGQRKNAGRSPFYDIVSGCNSNDITALNKLTAFCAKAGYDQVTGWGSANMLQLAWAINWEVIPATGVPYVTFTGNLPATNKWYNTNQTVNWKINDYVPKGGTPGTGIAGETQGWDSLPAEPSSEAHGGSGNMFYSGPQFPNGASGCLAFEPNGCSGGVSQGCHTVYVRGWNNQGLSTAGLAGYPETYGPLCYDTVAPTISVANSSPAAASGWYTQAVSVTLTAADPGGSNASGVAAVYYGVNNASCSTGNTGACSTYGSAIPINTQGTMTINAFAEDKAGNFSTVSSDVVKIDTTPPVTKAGLSGTLVSGVYQSAVTVVLTASDIVSGVQTTYYSLNGGANVTYGGSFKISTAGSQTLKYWSVDVAGNTEAANSITLTIESPTTTTLSASPNPSVSGQTVTLTATVAATLSGALTGTVTFKNGSATLGSGTVTAGTASYSTSALAVGTHSLTAVYGGNANHLASTSSAVTDTVNPVTTTSRVVYIPDYYGKLLQVRAGTGTATAITINLPSCNPNSVAVNSNKAYVVCNSDSGNPDKILVYNAATIRAAAAGTLTISPLQTITSNQFDSLIGIAFDASNNLWVASYSNNQIDEITAASLATATPTVAGNPLVNSPNQPIALAFDTNGSLWVTGQYGNGILVNFPSSQLNQGTNAMPDYCLATTNLTGCQYVSGVFLNPEGLALFNGDVWVSNNSTGSSGTIPGRELVDIKYSGGSASQTGTVTVHATYGKSGVAADSPLVCPGGLFAGSVHLWVNDESYGESNPKCGANGDVASKTGGVFDFTTSQLGSEPTSASGVLAWSNITGRPGFGGIFVENDK